MKRIDIEFVTSRSWIAVWVVAGLISALVLGYCGWRYQAVESEMSRERVRLADLQQQWQKATQIKSVTSPTWQTSVSQARQRLAFDNSKVFAVIESVDVKGVRLKGLTLDVPSDILRLEYALEQATAATTVTDALNAGYDKRPWRLERITASAETQGSTMTWPSAMAPVTGVWSTHIGGL